VICVSSNSFHLYIKYLLKSKLNYLGPEEVVKSLALRTEASLE